MTGEVNRRRLGFFVAAFDGDAEVCRLAERLDAIAESILA